MNNNAKQLYHKDKEEYKSFFPIVRLEDIIETITDKSIQWLFNNYNHIYVEFKESVAETRNKVPNLLRRNGLWITYNTGKELITEQYIGSNNNVENYRLFTDDEYWKRFDDNEIKDGSITYDKLSKELQNLISNVDIINNPDEEDLTTVDNKIKIKDREYNKDTFSGLGHVILRKNIKSQNGKFINILTQDMINKPNTIYEIRYDFNLGGEKVEIPKNCVLKFEGGSLSDGEIVGLKTLLSTNSIHILKCVDISGTWDNENSYSDWFETDDYNASILISLQNLSRNIYIKNNFNTSSGVAAGLNKYTGEEDADIIISDNHNIIGDGIHSIIFKKMIFHNNVIVRNCIFDGNWSCRWASVSGNNVLIENTSFINIKSNVENLATVGLYLGNWYNQNDGYIWENITINNCVFDGFESYLSDDIDSDNVNDHVSRAIMAYSAINVRISNSTFKNMKGVVDSDYIMLHNLKQSDSRFPFDGTLILDYPTKDMTTLGRYDNMDAIICDNHFYQGVNKSSIKIMASNVTVNNNMFILSGEKESWGCIRGYNSENCVVSNNNIIVNSGDYTTLFEFRRCSNLHIHNNNISFDKASYIKALVNSQCNSAFLFSNNNIKGNNLEILIMTTYGNINCINNHVEINNININSEIRCKLLYGYGDIGTYKFPVVENIATVEFTNNKISYKSNVNALEFLPQYTENCYISNNIFECDNSIVFYTPADLSIYHDDCYYKYHSNIANCMIYIQGFTLQTKHLALLDVRNSNLRAILSVADTINIINNTFEVGTSTTNYYTRFSKNGIAEIKNNIFKKSPFLIAAFSIINNSMLKVDYVNNSNENEFYNYIEPNSSLSEDSHIDSLNKTDGLDYGGEITFNKRKNDSIFSSRGKTFIILDKGKFVFHDGTEWKTGDGFVLENRTGTFADKPSNLSWKDRGFSYYDEDSNRMIYYRGYKSENNDGWVTSDGVNASLKNKGSDSERPILSSGYTGYVFFDTTLNKPIWWAGTKWVNSEGKEPNNFLTQGTTAQRPTGVNDGFEYYDTTIRRPIYWNESRQGWINADGYAAGVRSGVTQRRTELTEYLTGLDAGLQFFDITLGKTVVWNGATWVNVDGSALE